MSNNDLTNVVTSSQIGRGTKNFSISNTRKRLLCIIKKSGVIVESKEIPVSVLETGNVIPLGYKAPIITTEMYNTSKTTQTNTLGKKVDVTSDSASGMPYTELLTENGTRIGNGFSTGNGLASDLSNVLGATITYNGSNSFTITVTDSTLSVYVY